MFDEWKLYLNLHVSAQGSPLTKPTKICSVWLKQSSETFAIPAIPDKKSSIPLNSSSWKRVGDNKIEKSSRNCSETKDFSALDDEAFAMANFWK